MPNRGEHLYILGHPVGHSKSPAMHNAAYAALGLDWFYGFADYPDPTRARSFIENDEWLALNVTMPYKPLALECANTASLSARLANGANVLVKHEGALRADNVDGKGCVAFLRRCGTDPAGKRVVVCGTGPTSLSIMHACVRAHASRVSLLGRDAGRTQAVLAAYQANLADSGTSASCDMDALSYDAAEQRIADAQVIVDATPLGMSAGDPAPFDVALLSAGQVVVDAVYGHGETALVAAARAAGCAAYDGSGMLVGQAVETIRVVAEATGLFTVPEEVDLFSVMAAAAGFEFAELQAV